jgi:ABC transporter substrate binding protein
MASHIERRKFLATLGGAAVGWPLAARAQQPAMPVVGFLRSGILPGPDTTHRVTTFHQGMKETGYVEGQNVAIDCRSDEGQTDKLPLLVADLLRRQVALIVGNTPSALAAKAATTTVPIVFVTGGDPVREGLVASLNRPGGNVTGVSFMSGNLPRSSLGSCVRCGREPRALPCSSIPNGPLRNPLSQSCGLRLWPSGSNSSSSKSAATAKSRPPLQRSSNVELTR